MINVSNMINILRLSLHSGNSVRNVSTYIHPLYFRATSILLAEPLKRKRRIDPAVVKARIDRKKKKLEKQIRRLENRSGIQKPIIEIDVLAELARTKCERVRDIVPLSKEEIRNRELLKKEWAKYKKEEWLRSLQIIKSIASSQEKALNELKTVSNDLYNTAVQIDERCLPYKMIGPLYTPPIDGYVSPDGDYIETTVKYTGET